MKYFPPYYHDDRRVTSENYKPLLNGFLLSRLYYYPPDTIFQQEDAQMRYVLGVQQFLDDHMLEMSNENRAASLRSTRSYT